MARFERDPTHKRVLEYGVRAPVLYGNLREQKGGTGFPRTPNTYRKPPGVFGRMYLGFLYSVGPASQSSESQASFRGS